MLFVLKQNDHDPSKLVAETPCKLLRYLVSDSSHIDADAPYAEVEVMKMCMPLLSPASGVIHFDMTEGQAMQVGGSSTMRYQYSIYGQFIDFLSF